MTSRAARKRRSAARRAAAPVPVSVPTPARAGRPAPPRTARSSAASRAQAQADELLPPWDRGPVRAYLRDVVDARRHLLGLLFMPAFALALITTVGAASELQRTLQLVSLVALGLLTVEMLARGIVYTRMARAEFPDLRVNLASSTFYVFMRAHRPRSMRKPAPLVHP